MMEVDSDEDLTKELQPLAYHVSDRKRVLREALKALKGKRLDAMIPPTLKTWDRNRLECACVEILEDVDDETLLAILDGRVGTAGVAAVEQPQPPSPIKAAVVKAKKKLKKKLAKGAPLVDGGNNDVEEDEPKKKKKKKVLVEEVAVKNGDKIAKLKKKKKLLKAKAKEKVKKKKKAAAASALEESAAPAPHKSLMELLELEYRAKAIKALLRSQGQTVPDIPLNIDENSEDAENSKVVEQETQVAPVAAKVNGATEGVSKPLNVTTSEQFKTEAAVAPPKPVQPLEKSKIKKPSESAAPPPPKASPKKVAVVLQKSTIHSPRKVPNVETPKKAVIELIDEALNTSFSEETEATIMPNNDVIEPPSVIAEACTLKNVDGEALRNKLLLKYQKQKHRKIKKKKPEPDLKDQEDILDLHPQELSLTDEEQAVGQNAPSCTENDTSEYSESEPEVEVSNRDISLKAETGPSLKKNIALPEDEELIYDEDSLDDEVASTDKNQIDEDEVSQVENMEVDHIQDSNNSVVLQTEQIVEEKVDEPEDAQISGSENTRDDPLSENSRSGMFSETTRDDVFEGAAGNSGFTQSLKRKITFRIDPARIGVLEEQGAEEEARKAEERKLEENDNEESEEEKEVEEGEIDSSEEAACGDEQLKSVEPGSTIDDKKRDLRDFLNRRHNNSQSVNTDDDTDESQDSTSYNARRKSYRKAADPERDFGTLDVSDAPKRPSSPVEFITQFSDMEPISEDSEHSESGTSKVASRKTASTSATTDLPIQGCAEKPSSGLYDKITTVNSTEKDLQSHNQSTSSAANLHNEDSQTSVASDTPSKSSIAEKADSESGGDEEEDNLPKPITWYERWAQSHGMQKVAKTNKIHKKVRTKLKQAISTKKKPIEMPKEEPSIEAEPIIGSIEEYEKLFGKKVASSEMEPAVDQSDSPNKSEMETSNQVDNNDDDDADDLWGDILGS